MTVKELIKKLLEVDTDIEKAEVKFEDNIMSVSNTNSEPDFPTVFYIS